MTENRYFKTGRIMEPEYNAVLSDFSNAHYEYTSSISRRLRDMSEDDLTFLWDAADSVTTSNCWYATYRVAPLIKDAIQRERYRRRRESEIADFTT